MGNVSFKSGPVLQAQLNRVKFAIDNDYTEPTDASLLDEALYNYFAIEKKEGNQQEALCQSQWLWHHPSTQADEGVCRAGRDGACTPEPRLLPTHQGELREIGKREE